MSVPDGMKVGQRWKAVREGSVIVGEVDFITSSGVHLQPDGASVVALGAGDWSWERLPDPEPEYEVGAVVRGRNRVLYERTKDGRWTPQVPAGYSIADDLLPRPLTLLVPQDGEK